MMQTFIKDYLEQTKIGRKQSYKNLALFPLLSSYSLDLDYLLLDEALSGDVIEVGEVGEEGRVPELKVVNKSPMMVLILDGEELVGAKQNRIVNTTILIKGNTTTVILVSRVEQGRWSYESLRFHREHKWIMSEKEGRDLGEGAVKDWIDKYAAIFREYWERKLKENQG